MIEAVPDPKLLSMTVVPTLGGRAEPRPTLARMEARKRFVKDTILFSGSRNVCKGEKMREALWLER